MSEAIRYIEAIERYERREGAPALFLAGGITGCPDWQQELVQLLCEAEDLPLDLLNPRRANFPINDTGAAYHQIKWEYDCLRAADAISFWFAAETIQPIVLYELGAWSMMDKPIFVGSHYSYPRLQDVDIQTMLVRPGVEILLSLEDLVEQIVSWRATWR